ncbi:MAG: aspartate/glutamate racemase family protein, partial [Desulfobacterales bacterium]|nr:aspartate/glutamate racemase family protein [Desulfobacterales bacterium]
GGMSWESTALYYQWINEAVKENLGGLNSARIAMVSVNFNEIEHYQKTGRWDLAGEVLGKAAQQVEAAGADFLLICTNTMHKVAPAVESRISIPLLHLADTTAEHIKKRGMNTVGLLGTIFTMEEDFYKGRLEEKYGLNVIIPSKKEREIVNKVIFEELCLGIIRNESRDKYLRIIEGMHRKGAEGIIEGCTEIVMLVNQNHTEIPLFDTTKIHVTRAVELAI